MNACASRKFAPTADAANLRLAHDAAAKRDVHLLAVGAGEDVGPRPLLQLRAQGRAAAEVQDDLDARVGGAEGGRYLLEGVRQRGGGEDRDAPRKLGARRRRLVLPAAGGEQGGDAGKHEKREEPHLRAPSSAQSAAGSPAATRASDAPPK